MSNKPDHQVQGIRDIVSSKRREFIERGLIEKSKKLARDDIDLNKNAIHTPPSPPPPPPPPIVVATSSRRKEKSISSIVDANISSSSTGRGRGRGGGRGRERGRGRRGSSQNNGNVDHFHDPSRFNDVVDMNKGDTHMGSLTQHNQHVQLKSTLFFSHDPNLFGTKAFVLVVVLWIFLRQTYNEKCIYNRYNQIKGEHPGSSSDPLLSGKATQLKQ
ncbi:hypothetical protein KY284_026332 [Solanum tuberosum]|nr:hypothetical protein KY284_026332 [Solanum tuberosum]